MAIPIIGKLRARKHGASTPHSHAPGIHGESLNARQPHAEMGLEDLDAGLVGDGLDLDDSVTTCMLERG
jgi:hypothetical protein